MDASGKVLTSNPHSPQVGRRDGRPHASPIASSGATARSEEKKRLTERGRRSRRSSSRSTRRSSPAATCTARTRTTSRASSTSRSSARRRRTRPARPTTGWHPTRRYAKLGKLFDGSMKGRTMYVVPYVMGPRGSPMSKVGIEITDSIYVVLNMRIMTRMGRVALDMLGDSNDFNRGLHSVARLQPRAPLHLPLPAGQHDLERSAPGYGGNVLLGKKCLALRIGSYLGKQGGLARRAHAHPRRREPRGRDDVRRRGVPERVRQDELRDDDPAQALQGLEDLDRRRRHRVDARRRRTDASTPSTPRPATSASRRARATSRTRTR